MFERSSFLMIDNIDDWKTADDKISEPGYIQKLRTSIEHFVKMKLQIKVNLF